MIRGLYTAASGMLSAEVMMDTMANNLANVNTVGFKKNGTNFQSFPELMMQRMSSQGTEEIGTLNSGNKVRSTAIDFNQGGLRQTGNTLDVAIRGEGFFTVQNPENNEKYYTRNGEFIVNQEGYLSTIDGHHVMSQRGSEQETPIIIPRNAQQVQILGDGTVAVDGQTVGFLKIAQFKDIRTLEKYQETLFKTTEHTEELISTTVGDTPSFQLFQGNLEQANVNVISEMVTNITGMRLYESLQKNIQMQNSTLEKVVNEVGRTR